VTTPTVGSTSLATQDVSVSVTGSYDETERLLQNLEHMPRAYLMTSVALSGSDSAAVAADGSTTSAGGFTTTITGEMFVMPPIADPGDTGTAQ
jgi:Tfp pilus assembly protein PilO